MKSLSNHTTLTAFIKRINNLNEQIVPKFGPMTTHEIICHTSDTIRVSLGIRRATNRSNWFTRSLKSIVLKGIIPDWWLHKLSIWFFQTPELDQSKEGSIPGDFAKDKEELIQLTLQMASMNNSNKMGYHPQFGDLSYEEQNRMNYLHLEYHLSQCGV